MTRLTATQAWILSAAAARDDGTVEPLPDDVNGGAGIKAINVLLAAGYITPLPFTITSAGRATIEASPKDVTVDVPEALKKLTVAQIIAAISVVSGEPVSAKSFNYKVKALVRLSMIMRDRDLSMYDVLAAAGVEAIAPDGKPISGLGLTPNRDRASSANTAATVVTHQSGSRQAALVEILKARQGASVEEIVDKFGWQPHTVRGAISGVIRKKMGFTVTSEPILGRGRVYRIIK